MTTPTLALLAVLLLAIPSKGPTPAPAKAGQEPQNQTTPKGSEPNSNQQPTGNASSALTQPRSVATTGEQPKAGKPYKAQATADWGFIWNIFNTALLTSFTGALAWLAHRQHQAMKRQAVYMRGALKETKKAADAAILSANIAKRALETLERADIMVTEVRLDNPDDVEIPQDTPVAALRWNTRISVVFKNVGRSKAKHLTHLCRLRLVNHEDLHHDWMTNSLPYELAPGEPAIANLRAVGDRLQPHIIDEINNGDKKLHLDCVVDYHDIFGNLHHAEVDGIYWPIKKAFQMGHSHELDYSAQDRGPYDLYGVSDK